MRIQERHPETKLHYVFQRGPAVIRRLTHRLKRPNRRRGTVVVEYLLLVTIVGIGVLVGLACLRVALVNELLDLSNAINAINC